MSQVHRRFSKWWLILAGLPVCLLIFALIVVIQAKAFLKSDRFRTFLGAKVSQTIRAKGAFKPLEWNGTSFYSESFTAVGGEKLLGDIQAQQIRAEVNLGGLWEKKWQVDGVEIERLQLAPGQPDISPATPKIKSQSREEGWKVPGFLTSWLPNQVDVQKVTVADFGLDGKNMETPFSLSGMKVEARPDGNAWMLTASSGSFLTEKLPKLTIEELALRYVDNTLFISRGALLVDDGGKLAISGHAKTGSPFSADLNVKVDQVTVGTILPEDWRARLHGVLSADFRAVADGKEWVVTGPVTLADGRLEGLPILDQVALFTRTQRFRQLNLDGVRADLTIAKEVITATNLNAESPGLLRITGGFVIKKGKMKGEFQVGVTPGSLRYIPGSQSKVFTVEREGYLWTTMKVTGSLDHLKEDLSERLAVAAGQEIIDTIQQGDPNKVKDTLKDAAESLLNLFK